MTSDLSLPGFAASRQSAYRSTAILLLKQWEAAGQFLQRIESGSTWWVGDWLRHGEGRPKWGDKYEQAISMFNSDYGTLANYKFVAKSVKFSRRRENLSWSRPSRGTRSRIPLHTSEPA